MAVTSSRFIEHFETCFDFPDLIREPRVQELAVPNAKPAENYCRLSISYYTIDTSSTSSSDVLPCFPMNSQCTLQRQDHVKPKRYHSKGYLPSILSSSSSNSIFDWCHKQKRKMSRFRHLL